MNDHLMFMMFLWESQKQYKAQLFSVMHSSLWHKEDIYLALKLLGDPK